MSVHNLHFLDPLFFLHHQAPCTFGIALFVYKKRAGGILDILYSTSLGKLSISCLKEVPILSCVLCQLGFQNYALISLPGSLSSLLTSS